MGPESLRRTGRTKEALVIARRFPGMSEQFIVWPRLFQTGTASLQYYGRGLL